MATTSSPIAGTRHDSPAPIAPLWHTLALVVFLLVFSALGSKGHQELDHSARVHFYLMTISMEWILVAYIVWGLRRTRRTTVGELIGGRWNKPEDFILDIAIAVGFWIAAALVLGALAYLLGMQNMATVKDLKSRLDPLLPEGTLEMLLWVGISVTAGFCEEVIFRGYFQKQFSVVLKSAWAGILLQGLIFGGSHAYEGWRQMIRIAVFGIMFGILAHWRKSLRPGMMAHFAQDAAAGLLARAVFKAAEKALPH